MRRVLAAVAAAALGVVAAQGLAAHGASSAPATAAEDVRLLGQMIEAIHPEPYRAIPRKRFRAQLDAVAKRAPELERNELLVELLRLVALLGPRNGHTGIFPLDPSHTRELHLFPVRLYDFADGLFVVDDRGAGLVGARLVAVEGRPVADVLARVRPLVPRDNPSQLRGLTPHFLLVAEVLDGLGIADRVGPAELTFERPGGTRVDARLAPIEAGEYRAAFADAAFGHYPSRLPAAARPLFLSNGSSLWARSIAGGRAVYVQFNTVTPPDLEVVRRIERLVRGPGVRRVVLDVRLNGGGDNTTYSPLTSLFGSPSIDRRGRLYLLTGRATFSAAANFAAEIERDTRALVVGEPTGGGVETYGDTNEVLLRTAGLSVHIAAQYHERRRGPKDRRLAVEPDLRVNLTSADFFAKRDPVLERALEGL